LVGITLVAGAALLLRPAAPPVAAASLLANGSFEQWTPDGQPAGWKWAEGRLTQVTAPELVAEGSSAAHFVSNGNNGSLWQWVAVTAGGRYRFSGKVWLGSAPEARLRIDWKDADYNLLGSSDSAPVTMSGTYQPLEVVAAAPAGTAFALPTVVVLVDNVGEDAYLDALSFEEQAPPPDTPTPAPTNTNTPVPSPTALDEATPVPSGAPDASPTSAASQTPSPSATGTASPLPTAEVPDDGSGGMLRNGGFEREAAGVPADWRKYGGRLSSTTARVHGGSRAAVLESTTSSTKWVYQSAPVTGGGWYTFKAYVWSDDGAEVLLRISWYGTPDGSGSSSGYSESPAVVGPTGSFVLLETGPVQAPADAASARARIVLRPGGDAATAMYVDDARMEPTSPPPPDATPSPPSTPAAESDDDEQAVEPPLAAGSSTAPVAAPSPHAVRGSAPMDDDEDDAPQERSASASRSQQASGTTAPAASTAPKPTATLFSQVSSLRREPPAATVEPQPGGRSRPLWLWGAIAAGAAIAAAAGGYALYRGRRT